MDFDLTRTQKEIMAAAREFAKGEFDPLWVQAAESSEYFPFAVWKKATDLGFIGLNIPEELSGGGLGMFEAILVAETWCRQCSTMGIALVLTDLAAEIIYRFGETNQKKKYVPALLEGHMLIGISLQDIGAAFDQKIDCCIASKGDLLEISGGKKMVANALSADAFILLCRDYLSGKIGFWLAEKQNGDVAISQSPGMLGMRLSSIRDIELDRVGVSSEHCLGRNKSEATNLKCIQSSFHLKMAAVCLGIAQGALDRSLAYVKERTQFGKKIAEFQVSRHKLAEMFAALEKARLLTYATAVQQDAGRQNICMPAAAKLAACRAALGACYEAIQLHGGYGYITEYEVERRYRDAKAIQIVGGNPHSLKDVIADHLLAKPL